MTISFTIAQAFDEPLVRSRMKWEAGPNTTPECIDSLSAFYVTVENDDGTFGYIRIHPVVVNAGDGFGRSSSSSPSWDELICSSARENASCLPRFEAEEALEAGLNFDSFEVITDASVVSTASQAGEPEVEPLPATDRNDEETLSAFDRLLNELDQDGSGAEISDEPGADPGLAAANAAARQVLSLVSEPLAQYRTPAHQCEGPRQFSNWVSIKSACEISFRREADYDFLCADGSESRSIHTASSVDLDFSQHIADIEPVKQSGDGWVALVLQLTDKIAKGPANARVNRWQFTAGDETLDEMTALARNLKILRSYCENT